MLLFIKYTTGHKRPVEQEEPHLDDEEEDEDGRTSPLYSNWDLRGMQHLLPLQDYIIQQAKLSSEYLIHHQIKCV